MYLLPTNITRTSTSVLRSVQKKPSQELLDIAEEMTDVLDNNNRSRFVKLIKEGWEIKKNTSELILGNPRLKIVDKELELFDEIICHRLIGAGNGGYFLLFAKLKTEAECIAFRHQLYDKLNSIVLPVEIDYNGLEVKKI